jgi:tetratricopeptide (TPR) repeat protein
MSSKSRKQQIEEMLADDPNDPFLRYGLAMEDISVGDDEGAARCLQELLAVDAAYVPAYLQLGQVLTRLGRADEARAAYTRGIAIAQQQSNGHAAEEMQRFLLELGG